MRPNKLRLATVCGLILSAWISLSAAEPGVTDSEIVIGQSGPLTGPLSALAKELQEGSRLYLDQVNSAGGVHGRSIKIVSMDDAYDPKRTVENTRTMIERDHVFALFAYAGTPTTLAVLPLVEEQRIPMIAPFTGVDVLRDQRSRYVFNVRARYSDEIEGLVSQLTAVGIKQIAVAYLNNPFGKSGLAAVEASMKKRGLAVPAAAPIELEGTDLAQAVQAIAKVKPDAIILASAGKPTSDFIAAYLKIGLKPQFYVLSVISSHQLTKALGGDSRGVVISQVMPYPWARNIPVAIELQKLAAAHGITNITYNHMEGFIDAKVLVEGLKGAGKNLSRESLMRSLERMQGRDLGGFNVSLSEGNHNASTYVDLTIVGRDAKLLR